MTLHGHSSDPKSGRACAVTQRLLLKSQPGLQTAAFALQFEKLMLLAVCGKGLQVPTEVSM